MSRITALDRPGLEGRSPRRDGSRSFPCAIALAAAAVALAGCAKPELREIPEIDPAQLRARCGVSEPPVSLEQARCIAGEVGLETAEGACSLEEGTSLRREPIWVARESCAVNPRCVEVWIRQSDGAIVNTRYLYVFGDPSEPVSR